MEQYISKSALVAEIAMLQATTMDEDSNFYTANAQAEYNVLCMLDSFIDTLEVKEVDLEKEISNWRNNHYHKKFYKLEGYTSHYTENSTILDIAKHFFELGLKVQKGE